MDRRITLGLFIAGLLVALVAASLERTPGYMDAEYYYAGALRLISGQGATEPYVWNYLNDPAGLPAPSFAYWMPLSALVAAAGLAAARPFGFWAARLGFILLAACVPVISAQIARRLTGNDRHALLAGLLALFPGFYLAYQTTTDAFPLYMALGGLFLLQASEITTTAGKRALVARMGVLGALVGLLHLTRADGLMWLAGTGLVALAASRQSFTGSPRGSGWLRLAGCGAAVLAGYALVAAPWYIRNELVWGSLLPPGSGRAMWITEYEQTMLFPASSLTMQHWLAAGWNAHLQSWLTALSNNFQTALAVQGGILQAPFILAGLWKMRGNTMVRLGAVMWLLTAAVMTVVFPLAGMNGGFFHSGAALQPLWWALAAVGIESAAAWYVERRRLSAPENMVRFVSALVVLVAVLLTGVLFVQRTGLSLSGDVKWSASDRHYLEVDKVLAEQGALPGDSVLVNNPPGFWLATGRPAVVIPDGDERMLLAAAQKFHIRYLVLEVTNPLPLADLYHARVNPPELEYLTTVDTTRIYRIHLPGD